eukprot:UN02379
MSRHFLVTLILKQQINKIIDAFRDFETSLFWDKRKGLIFILPKFHHKT